VPPDGRGTAVFQPRRSSSRLWLSMRLATVARHANLGPPILSAGRHMFACEPRSARTSWPLGESGIGGTGTGAGALTD
jgi:hypothetical protein